jgi:hypothetical protein
LALCEETKLRAREKPFFQRLTSIGPLRDVRKWAKLFASGLPKFIYTMTSDY